MLEASYGGEQNFPTTWLCYIRSPIFSAASSFNARTKAVHIARSVFMQSSISTARRKWDFIQGTAKLCKQDSNLLYSNWEIMEYTNQSSILPIVSSAMLVPDSNCVREIVYDKVNGA